MLPTLGRFDLLLTDPPYGIGEAKKANSRATDNATRGGFGDVRPTHFESAGWDNTPPPALLFKALLDVSRWAIVWGGNFFDLPPGPCWLVWDKDNGTTDFADCELAWTNLEKAVRKIRYRWNGMLQEKAGHNKEKRLHPTMKPLDVMSWAIQQAPPGCATIIDPFMGSGTTLVAARNLGRQAVGIEREEQYCAAAVNRLRQGVLAL